MKVVIVNIVLYFLLNTNELVFGMVEGEGRPGRRVRRWIDDILMWCGKDVQEAMMMTVYRDNWRRIVASHYSPC